MTLSVGKCLGSMGSPPPCTLPTRPLWEGMNGVKLPWAQGRSPRGVDSLMAWDTHDSESPSAPPPAEKLRWSPSLTFQMDRVNLDVSNILTQASMFACRTWKALIKYNLSLPTSRRLKTFFT